LPRYVKSDVLTPPFFFRFRVAQLNENHLKSNFWTDLEAGYPHRVIT
jgi:hypothetical protein